MQIFSFHCQNKAIFMSDDDGTWNKILRTIMGQFRLSFPPLVAKRLMLLALILILKKIKK